jgi:hypothetical protein
MLERRTCNSIHSLKVERESFDEFLMKLPPFKQPFKQPQLSRQPVPGTRANLAFASRDLAASASTLGDVGEVPKMTVCNIHTQGVL